MNDAIGVSLVLIISGLTLIGIGVGARLGYFKRLYLIKGIPGLYPSGYVYAFMPAGVGFLILAFIMVLPDKRSAQDIVIYGLSTLFLLSIILMIWKPSWLKPWWLKWLEDHYGSNTENILEKARKTKEFDQQIQTEADLAAWVDNVTQRRG